MASARSVGVAGEVTGKGQPVQRSTQHAGLAQFVAVVAQGIGVQAAVTQSTSDRRAFAGPACGRGETFLGQHVAERDAEADTGAGQQTQHIGLGVAVSCSCFETGDERPELVDGSSCLTGLAGDLGQTQDTVGELDHGAVVPVGVVGDPEDVVEQRKAFGDLPQGDDVGDGPAARLHPGDVGGRVPEQGAEFLLWQVVQLAVEDENLGQPAAAQDGLRPRSGPVPADATVRVRPASSVSSGRAARTTGRPSPCSPEA